MGRSSAAASQDHPALAGGMPFGLVMLFMCLLIAAAGFGAQREGSQQLRLAVQQAYDLAESDDERATIRQFQACRRDRFLASNSACESHASAAAITAGADPVAAQAALERLRGLREAGPRG